MLVLDQVLKLINVSKSPVGTEHLEPRTVMWIVIDLLVLM